VAEAVGQRARRLDDAVDVRPQPRQLVRQRPRDALDAANLLARGGACVDDDRPDLIG
jgi:hypothetical protein